VTRNSVALYYTEVFSPMVVGWNYADPKLDVNFADGNIVRFSDRQVRNILSNHIRDNLETFGIDYDFVLVLTGDE